MLESRPGAGAAGSPAAVDLTLAIDTLVDFEATVHVRDLVIPEDVTLLTDPDEIVARVQQPRVEEVEEVVEVAAEGEEAEEGGEAAASDAGESPAEGSTEG